MDIEYGRSCAKGLINKTLCIHIHSFVPSDRWRLVIHGAINVWRLITYLKCSNNNRSETVLRAFREGVQHYGMPERIRTDRGGENVQVSPSV